MAELADAQASGACGSNIVWVQVPSPASSEKGSFEKSFLFFCRDFLKRNPTGNRFCDKNKGNKDEVRNIYIVITV